MTDTSKEAAEWPREIWMAEREDFDQGVVSAVLSESATVARFPGDKERDRDFHRYVDADIHESAERYFAARYEAIQAERGALRAEVERLRDALTPSGDTKADYIGEFSMTFPEYDEDGQDYMRKINIPWVTIKKIMSAILARAALQSPQKEAE